MPAGQRDQTGPVQAATGASAWVGAAQGADQPVADRHHEQPGLLRHAQTGMVHPGVQQRRAHQDEEQVVEQEPEDLHLKGLSLAR